MIGAGKRDCPVEFQRATIVPDDYGQEVPSWAKLQGALAAVRYGTSAERRNAAAIGSEQSATFRVLATAALRGVTGKDRIVAAGAVWNVKGPPAEIGRSELEFTAVRSD